MWLTDFLCQISFNLLLYVLYVYVIIVLIPEDISQLRKETPMKLYFDKRAKDPIYYVQLGYRNAEGRSTTKNIQKLGRHSELLKITDDPVAYCKEKIRKMNEDAHVGRLEVQVTVNLNEKVDDTVDEYSRSDLRNIGYFYLQNIYQQLEIKKFLDEIASKRRFRFDADLINRFLTFARILDPRSKLGIYDHLDTYFEDPKFSHQQGLRFMDVLFDNTDAYLKWLYEHSNNVIRRDTSVIYYDCTNFFFESERPDEIIIDEVTGEEISYGLRQYGVSKEHRPSPIVEMGLLMDRRGIPITMCIHPGNTSEQITAVPLEKDIIGSFVRSEFIYCADAGLGSYNIRQYNSMQGRSFIVTQSIKKMSEVLQAAVFNDCDYRLLSSNEKYSVDGMKTFDRFDEKNISLYNDCVYKVIPADHVIELGLYDYKPLKNGGSRKVKAKGDLKQYIIVTFSRKMMEYQRTVRNRQIERAKKLLKVKKPEDIKKGPNDVKRFLKKKGGEDKKAEYEIDYEKIAEEEKYDGYYAVATDLDPDDVKGILGVAHRRYKIEECFRIMKSNFDGRPVYHYTDHRIRTHFLICYTALLIYRLLECSLEDKGYHVTTNNLIETLKNMNVVSESTYYIATYKGSKALKALTDTFNNLVLDCKRYDPKELKKTIKNLKR